MMIRGTLTILTFVSILFFPWPLSVILVFATGAYEPFVPLAAGLFIDTLFYVPAAHNWPLFTIGGILVTFAIFWLRSRLSMR